MEYLNLIVCGLFLILDSQCMYRRTVHVTTVPMHSTSAGGFEQAVAQEYCFTPDGIEYCAYGCCDDGCCLAIIPIIIGSVIGGLILIALIITVICCCIKTGHKKGQVVAPAGATTGMVQPPSYNQATSEPVGHGHAQTSFTNHGFVQNSYGLGGYGQTAYLGAPQFGMQPGFGHQPVYSTQPNIPTVPPPAYGDVPPPVGSHSQPALTEDSSNIGAPHFPPAQNSDSSGLPPPAQY